MRIYYFCTYVPIYAAKTFQFFSSVTENKQRQLFENVALLNLFQRKVTKGIDI